MLSDIKRIVTRYRLNNGTQHSNTNNQELHEEQALRDDSKISGIKEFEKTGEMVINSI